MSLGVESVYFRFIVALTPSLSRSRALSLRAPIGSEEERAHFQRRIALANLVVALLALGFWLAALVSMAIVTPEHALERWHQVGTRVHLLTVLAGLGIWLFVRNTPRSARTLDVLDAVCTIAICFSWTVMVAREEPRYRPEFVGILAISYTLILRAAFIPSTPARTGLIGLVAFAPLVVLTDRIYANAGLERWNVVIPTVYAAIWGALGVAATKIVSWVIYGLQREVARARRLGQYVLEEKIGEGGMGAVFRASHALLRRPTAIKLVAQATGATLERFEREVQQTARLTHPNTVVVFDYGRTPDGVFYYAMEYIAGLSLEELVVRHGPQPPARVVHLLTQACGALHEAHEAGLVHRDIKPANLMLTTRGGVYDVLKVLDFGLVKETISSERDELAVTGARTLLGTPHYMAPEAIAAASEVDGRADLYALGATAFYLLTGRPLFEGRSAFEICGKHLHVEAPRVKDHAPNTPAALDELVAQCLKKSRDERPASAQRLAMALQELDMPPWTQAEAESFWRTREAVPASAVRPGGALGATVAVALDGRA